MHKFTAIAYYGGIPPNNTNPEKPLILDNFCHGVIASGDMAIQHKAMTVLPCDVALIQGFVHEHGKHSPHLLLRRQAVDLQKRNNKRSLIVDSNLFLYADPGNTKTYLRYSFDGVFPTTGFYFDKDIDPQRWQKISQRLNLTLKPWRTQGENILICLQRNGGWSMQGLNTVEWLNRTIEQIRSHSKKRHIVVRGHPGDKKTLQTLMINHKNVSISNNDRLVDDLRNSWATVVYNSSPSVASIIEGVPTFLTDPRPENSQSCEVSNIGLERLEDPLMPDRQSWIERLAMCHWSFDELKSGEAWRFFRQYI